MKEYLVEIGVTYGKNAREVSQKKSQAQIILKGLVKSAYKPK